MTGNLLVRTSLACRLFFTAPDLCFRTGVAATFELLGGNWFPWAPGRPRVRLDLEISQHRRRRRRGCRYMCIVEAEEGLTRFAYTTPHFLNQQNRVDYLVL